MNIMRDKYSLSSFLTIITLLSIPQKTNTIDTINTSHIFRDNGETLISSNGSFVMGFFSPANSKNRYVGIWYKKITVRTIIWAANRGDPLTDGSGSLKVVGPGVLVLLNGTNGIIWSTNTSRNVQNPVAQLLDSGNLVVKDANDDNPENYLWESFDYPTDTFLPGMKLGVNFRTGLEVHITSSKNDGTLALGDYTYHCDPTGYPQNLIKKGEVVRYRTGPWNGIGFSGSPNLENNQVFLYGMVINKNEVYYHYDLINDSVITRFTLSDSGVGQRWVWVDRTQEWVIFLIIPIDNCDIFNSCGAYSSCDTQNSPVCGCLDKFKPKDPQGWERGDWTNGCVRRTPLDCDKGDIFLRYSHVKLPDTRSSWYNKSMSLEECKVLCLKNCLCTAYASLDISRGENGCLLWFGDLVDIREIARGQDIYIRMASSESDSKGRKQKVLMVTLPLVIGVLLLSLSLFLCFRKREKKDHQLQETECSSSRLNYPDNHRDESRKHDLDLPLLDLSTILKATDYFSFSNKIGEGGFGPVYKGLLVDGQEIAVKRLSKTSHQGVDEFKNEVVCIAKLQHRNLVKLLGCCIHGEEMMLVYEYMVNKSLNLVLFDPTKSILLDWHTRFNIINGVARGLMYLHQDSRLRVIHRDLKASNILLDSDMNPKISDFGIARIFGGNETGAGTNRIVGTYGYMSPEYVVDGLFSVKSDVFSYGVLVLETVSGKRNRGFSHRDHSLNLLGHAWMLYREERSSELVESSLRDSCDTTEVMRSIHVGLLCVQENPGDRPNMSSVVLMLSNDGVLPEAKHPGFFTGRERMPNETSDSTNTASSKNAMTITLLEAR